MSEKGYDKLKIGDSYNTNLDKEKLIKEVVEKTNKEESSSYEQISIFDDLED